MKRTQLRLDEDTYELLRAKALERGISISAMIREILEQHLSTPQGPTPRLKDFTFIGSGSSAPSDLNPISERHDEALDRGITL